MGCSAQDSDRAKGLMFVVYGLLFRCADERFMFIDLRLRICCFWFENGCVLEPGKTRGAIGFALIFLCFVSLYQDKEMKRKDICLIGPFLNGDVCCSASRI